MELDPTKSKLVFYQGHVLSNSKGEKYHGTYLFFRESIHELTGYRYYAKYVLNFENGMLHGSQWYELSNIVLLDQRQFTRKYEVQIESGKEYWAKGRLETPNGEAATYKRSYIQKKYSEWDVFNDASDEADINYEQHRSDQFYRCEISKNVKIEPYYNCLRGIDGILLDPSGWKWRATDYGLVLHAGGYPIGFIDTDDVAGNTYGYVIPIFNQFSEEKQLFRLRYQKDTLVKYQEYILSLIEKLYFSNELFAMDPIQSVYLEPGQLRKVHFLSFTKELN
jgi:hypothetical protein